MRKLWYKKVKESLDLLLQDVYPDPSLHCCCAGILLLKLSTYYNGLGARLFRPVP